MSILREELLAIAREQQLIETEMVSKRLRRHQRRHWQTWAFATATLAALATCALILASELNRRSAKARLHGAARRSAPMCVAPLPPRAVASRPAQMSTPITVGPELELECLAGTVDPVNEDAVLASSPPKKKALKAKKKHRRRGKAKRSHRRRRRAPR